MPHGPISFLPPATKSGQGYVFTRVCDSVHSRGCLGRHPPRSRHPPGADTPPLRSACREIRATGGLYASYWNAIFLFIYIARVIDTAASQLTKTAITVTAIFIVVLRYDCWYYILGHLGVTNYIYNSPKQKFGKCFDKETRLHY